MAWSTLDEGDVGTYNRIINSRTDAYHTSCAQIQEQRATQIIRAHCHVSKQNFLCVSQILGPIQPSPPSTKELRTQL